ncbi:hypothetical protein D9M69_383960 [compost metagenome]
MTSEQLARLCAGIPIQQMDGFTGIKPLPARRDWIDPETRLKRRDRLIRPMHEGSYIDRKAAGKALAAQERIKLRQMTEAL